jgi:hypothetical protein
LARHRLGHPRDRRRNASHRHIPDVEHRNGNDGSSHCDRDVNRTSCHRDHRSGRNGNADGDRDCHVGADRNTNVCPD